MRLNLRREIDESYDIVFGRNLFPRIAKDLKAAQLCSRYAIITDSNVKFLYGNALEKHLKRKGLAVDTFTFTAGERSKTRETKQKIEDEMLEAGLGRDTVILALGGGVVGDLAGFIAATFNREVPYIQIPTTLLAQADSSIGGKVAVDTSYGKNLIGAFKQPWRVYIDIVTLATLAEKDYRTGLAETIKHGIILDAKFFRYLQRNSNLIMSRDSESLLYIARQNCRIKGSVVEQDPHEKGPRRILNYGHTIGHALEQLSDFELPHGEAVSIGMMVAGRIANMLGYFPQRELARQERLLLKIGLPTRLPRGISNESIIEVASRDKKAKGGRVRYVLPLSIGKIHGFGGVYASYVDDDIVIKALEQTYLPL